MRGILRKAQRLVIHLLLGMLVLVLLVYGIAYLFTDSSLVARALIWRDSEIDDYRRFPYRVLNNAAPVFSFKQPPDDAATHATMAALFQQDSLGVGKDFDRFLESSDTTAFLVIKDDVLLYEKYFHGYTRNSTQTSMSMAKSMLSTLVGIAIDEGAIANIDDPITHYIPELSDKDQRFTKITIRHLLTMTSGIKYAEQHMPWSDDTATYYSPALRALALSAAIDSAPGQTFHYNNYNPLLLGMALERATGRSVSQYMEQKIWQPLGMEAPGSWSIDSTEDGFEKMESGVNGLAIDFAKFGRLFLNKGNWNGKQIVSRAWVEEATRLDTTTDPSGPYQYMWWVTGRPPQTHFLARGRYGQFIFVAPEQNFIVVRFGLQAGGQNWMGLFEKMVDVLDRQAA